MVRRGLGAGRRAFRRPGRLRWRLTISYALVTLVAAGAISVAGAAGQASRGADSADSVGAPATLEKSAGSAVRYLAGPAPDPEALRFWIAVPLMVDLSRQRDATVLAVAVVDGSGALLTAESCTRAQYNASSAAACRADGRARAEAFLADASGRQAIAATVREAHDRSITGDASGRGFVATPVADGGQPIGALVAIFDRDLPAVPQRNWLATFGALAKATWSPSWLPLILLAIVLGTATGFALSHQLVRRLRAMATTARVWSSGDLRPVIEVHGRDELALLSTDLNQMAEQLRNLLAARREIATMQERHRVQRDLHDGVKQELFAVSLQLAAARSAAAGEANLDYLDEAEASTRRAQRELTAIIEQLRPPLLSPHGLSTAIADLCTQFTHQTGLPVHRDVPPDARLPAPVEEALVRITQEALTNIRRHAHAHAVTVRLTEDDGQLTLLIADDGRGLPPDAARAGGVGLTSMRERAETVGARLELRAGQPGTLIAVVIAANGGGWTDA